MGSCGDTPANECDAGNVKWFKIDEVGRSSNGKWAQAALSAFFSRHLEHLRQDTDTDH